MFPGSLRDSLGEEDHPGGILVLFVIWQIVVLYEIAGARITDSGVFLPGGLAVLIPVLGVIALLSCALIPKLVSYTLPVWFIFVLLFTPFESVRIASETMFIDVAYLYMAVAWSSAISNGMAATEDWSDTLDRGLVGLVAFVCAVSASVMAGEHGFAMVLFFLGFNLYRKRAPRFFLHNWVSPWKRLFDS